VVWDVQEGSPSHRDELFGPVACVMRARDLDHAIQLVNASGYGLTSALESLDEREWRHWIERIHAGNLYVNRPLVGAVVERQPFGGWGLSGLGPGAKTGGPNYAAQLVRVTGEVSETTRYDGRAFAETRHTQRIPGQLNLFRYRPCPAVVVRVEAGDDPLVVRLRRDAARAAGAAVEVSDHVREPLDELIARLHGVTRVVMCCESAPRALLDAAARSWTWVCREPLTGTARDLLPFLREQSISIDTQRHGWIAPQADTFLP
jgi:RHH-type proline utilization regulon transcriptional repressor/proline dehydrogenase/delta 1-pyrroline-5-carboxylate dehydrogenase